MALYQYKCSSCEHLQEFVIPMSEEAHDKTCNKCGSPSKRVIGTFAFSMGNSTTKSGRQLPTLGSFPDKNDWIDA